MKRLLSTRQESKCITARPLRTRIGSPTRGLESGRRAGTDRSSGRSNANESAAISSRIRTITDFLEGGSDRDRIRWASLPKSAPGNSRKPSMAVLLDDGTQTTNEDEVEL